MGANKLLFVVALAVAAVTTGCGGGGGGEVQDWQQVSELDGTVSASNGEALFDIEGREFRVQFLSYHDGTPIRGIHSVLLTHGEKTCLYVWDPDRRFVARVLPGPQISEVSPQWLDFFQEIELYLEERFLDYILDHDYRPVGLESIDSTFWRYLANVYFQYWRRTPLDELESTLEDYGRAFDITATETVVSYGIGGPLGIVDSAVSVIEWTTRFQHDAFYHHYANMGYQGDQIFEIYRPRIGIFGVDYLAILILPTEEPEGQSSDSPTPMLPPVQDVPTLPAPGDITVSFVATGSITGHVADCQVHNNASSSARTKYLAGTILEPVGADVQRIVLISNVELTVPASQTLTASVHGCCANLDRPGPDYGDIFVVGSTQRDELIAVTYTAYVRDTADYIVQQAVWVITDDSPPYDWQEVYDLFIAAGLNPDDYPAMSTYSVGSTSPRPRKLAP